MGTKQTWNRKYIFLYATCIIITMFTGIQGCVNFEETQRYEQGGNSGADIPMNSENNNGSIKEIKEVLNLFPELARKGHGKQDLAIAKTFMFKGDYNASILYNKKVLDQFYKSLGDLALFQMGQAYVHPGNPKLDNQKSLECFQRIIEEFPDSKIRDDAGIWILVLQKIIKSDKEINSLRRQKNIENNKIIENLQLKNENLHHQIENLKNQIKKLKEIDLGIEDKKRIDLPEERGEM